MSGWLSIVGTCHGIRASIQINPWYAGWGGGGSDMCSIPWKQFHVTSETFEYGCLVGTAAL